MSQANPTPAPGSSPGSSPGSVPGSSPRSLPTTPAVEASPSRPARDAEAAEAEIQVDAPPYRLGVDIGGTRIKAGIIGPDDRPLVTDAIDTPADSRPAPVVAAVAGLADRLCQTLGIDMAQLPGIGIGLPGLLDTDAGIAHAVVNLDQWHEVPLCDLVRARTGLPAAMVNDANAAALGEFTVLRRDDPSMDHLALLTLGTGIGAGLVLHGQVFRGNGMAGELGHMIVEPAGPECGCGQHGCLEMLASAPAIVRLTRQALQGAPEPSPLAELGEAMTVRDVFDAARAGDALADRALGRVCDALALACVNLRRVLDVPNIVIGGGVAQAGQMLLTRVEEAYQRQTWRITPDRPALRLCRLGNDAGFVGAAALSVPDAARSGQR